MKITFAESASEDMEQILAYYEERGVPEVGQRFVTEITDRIQRLRDHPDLGRVVPEFDTPYIRELIHPPFRIVYRRDPRHVRIVRVWRSERQLKLP